MKKTAGKQKGLELNKVTTISKVVAAILFILLPVIMFWIGLNKGVDLAGGCGASLQSIFAKP